MNGRSCITAAKRCMATSSTLKGPSVPLTSWESGARSVKNVHVENKYLEHIRDIHDPSQHIKTIEDELKGTIGKALGKQGEKVIAVLRLMAAEHSKYLNLLDEGHTHSSEKVVAAAKQFNEYRTEAHKKRWELIVHRQAVGFTVGNHKFITEKFPIGEPLPVEEGDSQIITEENRNNENTARKKVFGDQLDWWEKIG